MGRRHFILNHGLLILDSLQDLLVDYVTLFGAKTCVFDDLYVFVEVFSEIDREAVLRFIQQLQEMANSEPVDFDCPDEELKNNVGVQVV